MRWQEKVLLACCIAGLLSALIGVPVLIYYDQQNIKDSNKICSDAGGTLLLTKSHKYCFVSDFIISTEPR